MTILCSRTSRIYQPKKVVSFFLQKLVRFHLVSVHEFVDQFRRVILPTGRGFVDQDHPVVVRVISRDPDERVHPGAGAIAARFGRAVQLRWLVFGPTRPTAMRLFSGDNEGLSGCNVDRYGDFVVVEHSGRNELSDGRRYDNNYCWVFRFQDGLIQEVREYMDTQLVTETFGPDGDS